MSDFVPPKQTSPKGITPQAPKEPPAHIQKLEFSLDPGIKFDADEQKVVTEDKTGKETTVKVEPKTNEQPEVKTQVEPAKVATEKKVEPTEKKVEQKVEEPKLPSFIKPPAKKEDKKDEAGKIAFKQVTPKKPEERDYSGYSPEETAALKQMSNEAFDFTTKVLKQNRELAQNKDGAFYQHPDAYRLHPEFRTTQNNIIKTQSEGDIWKQVLASMRKGNATKVPVGFDPQTGNFVFSEQPVTPNEEIEETVRLNMQRCYSVAEQLKGQLNNFGQNYQSRIKQDLAAIQNERSARFSWVANPELLDYTIGVETDKGIVDMPIKQIRQDFINILPPYIRENPGTQIAADLMVSLMIANGELREARNGKEVAEIKQKEIQRGEPSSETRQIQEAGKEINGVRTFSLDGMPK